MKIGSLILGFVVGVIVTYFVSTRQQFANAVELGFLNGKLSVMQEVCPSVAKILEKKPK